jgi:hypothetical protein
VVIGLLGGVLPATAALKASGVSSVTFFSEIANDPLEVVSAHWPDDIPIGDMGSLDVCWFDRVVSEFPDSLFRLAGSIPCRDASRCVHELVAKFLHHIMKLTDKVVFTFECKRMDDGDRLFLSSAFGVEPIELNNRGWSPLSRPRWWGLGGRKLLWPQELDHGALDGIKRVRLH